MQENIIKHNFNVSREDRQLLLKQKPVLLWFTGLSGSGKSTIANAFESYLHSKGFKTYALDGDNVRKGINSNLSFSPEDRSENIRRIGEVANLMLDAGLIVTASFVSPYKLDRENVKNIVGNDNFVEIFIDTPIEECERRDVKGLYAKARKGEIKDFTGINAPYEAPENAAMVIKTTQTTIEEGVAMLFKKIQKKITV